MKGLFWNIRGMGQPARIRQLKELLVQHQVDIVGLQETIKQSFSQKELDSLMPGGYLTGTGLLPMAIQEVCLWV